MTSDSLHKVHFGSGCPVSLCQIVAIESVANKAAKIHMVRLIKVPFVILSASCMLGYLPFGNMVGQITLGNVLFGINTPRNRIA
mgnify:CR=1 FL=1